ncbi:ferredoxin [Streptomyces sp. 1114.5]|uniref:ferredoxin n=1 Tax=unclassified Streptomyces TaxID=2593676 RepID=UPI000BDA786F|nr:MULTISPECIES: ferredoxin [unclassified Streptomyces]RKT19398.1 ferredoxin [Streptomyces sp. 1114.5]SOB85594.1 ferredoxin [Streptomyces sp. 1331.2]
MQIRTDADRCIGAGRCFLAAPALFDQNDHDGTVVVLVEQVTGDQVEGARAAVDDCPTRTLSLIEG